MSIVWWQLGLWVLKATWSGELSNNYTTAVYIYIGTMEEETVGVNVTLNRAMREQFPRTPSVMALNFQRPG